MNDAVILSGEIEDASFNGSDGHVSMVKLIGRGFTKNIRCESPSEVDRFPDGEEVTILFKAKHSKSGDLGTGDIMCVLGGTINVGSTFVKKALPGIGKLMQEAPAGGVLDDDKPRRAAA